jgi:hypothetical protein
MKGIQQGKAARDLRTAETKQKLLTALEKNYSIVSLSCKEAGISRETYYQWRKTDEDFADKVESLKEVALDFAEQQLLKKIAEGSERSIIFFLKTKGKHRGYNLYLDVNVNTKITEFKFANSDINTIEISSDVVDDEDEDENNLLEE